MIKQRLCRRYKSPRYKGNTANAPVVTGLFCNKTFAIKPYVSFDTSYMVFLDIRFAYVQHLFGVYVKQHVSYFYRLRTNSGRFRERIPRIERRCQLCNQSVPDDLEEEFDFILKYQCFTDLRIDT